MDENANVNSGYTATDAINDLNASLQPYLERSYNRKDTKEAQKYQRDIMREQMTYQQANMERAYAQTSIASQMAQFRNAGLDPLAFLQYQRQQGIAPSAPSGMSAPQAHPFSSTSVATEMANRTFNRRFDELDKLTKLKDMKLTDAQRNQVDASIDQILNSIANDNTRVKLDELAYGLQIMDIQKKYEYEDKKLEQEIDTLEKQLAHAKYMQNEEHINQMERDNNAYIQQWARDEAARRYDAKNRAFDAFTNDYNNSVNRNNEAYWKNREEELTRELEEKRIRAEYAKAILQAVTSVGSAVVTGNISGNKTGQAINNNYKSADGTLYRNSRKK